ncbi:hypothetical protein GGS21DRAFT_532958 [Xylaria nigripes]|nr:hypothetical protein GGS21DRAFT_532958 [Xylaria nigripes]
MTIGTLHTYIVLDEPAKIHCGSRDVVRGNIDIRYAPSPKNPNAELFGPLKIAVLLHGRAKTKIWRTIGQNRTLYRTRAPLFLKQVLVYDDSFKAQPGSTTSFPFSLTFPEAVSSSVDIQFEADPKFVILRNQPLPPSFQVDHMGIATPKFEAFVEYRLGVDVVMPQLHVDVSKPIKYHEPVVYYERPWARHANRTPRRWTGNAKVSNELLLPAPDRPVGFRQKTKAFFGASHFPTYAFDWVCLVPTDIYLGQPISFQLLIKPRERECTASLIPDVRLNSFRVGLKAHINVRTGIMLLGRSLEASGDETALDIQGIPDTNEPFSSTNRYTKIITTRAIASDGTGVLSSTFATYNIALAYTLKVNLEFEVTKKVKSFKEAYPVTVHPPLKITPSSEASTPGRSAQSYNNNTEAEVTGLPRYEPAPSY